VNITARFQSFAQSIPTFAGMTAPGSARVSQMTPPPGHGWRPDSTIGPPPAIAGQPGRSRLAGPGPTSHVGIPPGYVSLLQHCCWRANRPSARGHQRLHWE
jgi:hypothetical protein